MSSKHARLDRFLSKRLQVGRGDVRLMLAQARVQVDGEVARDVQQRISQFSWVMLDDHTLQRNFPVYFMLNKPQSVVSATRDEKHTTVLDLIAAQRDSLRSAFRQLRDKAFAINPLGAEGGTDDELEHHWQRLLESLHIVGRLDFNSTGLLLLTNDGSWSQPLMLPATKVAKVYEVELADEISAQTVAAFAQGIDFDYEGITTQPAQLDIVASHSARVTLMEGRYHQIKRMFGRFDNEVLSLHRISIGNIVLDPNLAFGQCRLLTAAEVAEVAQVEQRQL